MCGIAGIVAQHAADYAPQMAAMLATLSHRGPDDSARMVFDGCLLGHTRLSIVDLAGGQQPMRSPVADEAVVFNGEIYGYEAIRDGLDDFPFANRSDTEVILALHQQHGRDLLEHLPGMFAFGLWDNASSTLFCARDRFGEKPLYYATGSGGELVFASELKAILASELVRPVLDMESVSHYFQHLYVHPHKTIYANIHVLPPAHRLTWRAGELNVSRYWSLPPQNETVGLADAAEQVGTLLDQAVGRQLVADVPVGAFLSGGLDSSVIVASAAREGRTVTTFSYGFEQATDERPYAREVAKRYQTDHHEMVDADTDIAAMLHTMMGVYDEPLADSSNIVTYRIAAFARQHVKVVLSGDGGDELLAGYPWYHPLQQMGNIPAWQVGLAPLLARLTRWQHGDELPPATRQRLAARRLRRDYASPGEARAKGFRYYDDALCQQLGLPVGMVSPDAPATYADPLDQALRSDLLNYMPGDILTKVDRATMAHGLELRAPFLDMELASLLISLPTTLKIDSPADKIVLRQAMNDRLPASVLARPKQGFGAPVDDWLQRSPDLITTYLDDPNQRIFDVIPFAATRELTARGDYLTWILLVFAMWAECHPFELAER